MTGARWDAPLTPLDPRHPMDIDHTEPTLGIGTGLLREWAAASPDFALAETARAAAADASAPPVRRFVQPVETQPMPAVTPPPPPPWGPYPELYEESLTGAFERLNLYRDDDTTPGTAVFDVHHEDPPKPAARRRRPSQARKTVTRPGTP
jgi:hypothetical protein